jgi:hypothetical protein
MHRLVTRARELCSMYVGQLQRAVREAAGGRLARPNYRSLGTRTAGSTHGQGCSTALPANYKYSTVPRLCICSVGGWGVRRCLRCGACVRESWLAPSQPVANVRRCALLYGPYNATLVYTQYASHTKRKDFRKGEEGGGGGGGEVVLPKPTVVTPFSIRNPRERQWGERERETDKYLVQCAVCMPPHFP